MRKADSDLKDVSDNVSSITVKYEQLQRDLEAARRAQVLAQERLDAAQHDRQEAVARLNSTGDCAPVIAEARSLLEALESSHLVDPLKGSIPEAVLGCMRALQSAVAILAPEPPLEMAVDPETEATQDATQSTQGAIADITAAARADAGAAAAAPAPAGVPQGAPFVADGEAAFAPTRCTAGNGRTQARSSPYPEHTI